ncbi:hypothetical protein M758_10G037200 [Ceratodon purpureus]|nr:hypothetical protein M758_10G037200 [Ceratodon purpureus]
MQSSDFRRTPGKTKSSNDPRATRGDVDDVVLRSTSVGGKTPISSDGPLETLHDVVDPGVSVVNQLAASKLNEPYLESIRFTIDGLETSKYPSENVQRHEGGAEAPISGAAVSNGSIDQRHKYFEHDFYPRADIENPDKLHSTSMQKAVVKELDGHEVEENDNPTRDVTGSEEVPTHRHERECSECGQTGGGSRSSNADEAELMRCCTQILELHCPHSLKADMRSPCAYPLCCPVPRFPLPAGNPTCSSKLCRSYVSQFTIDTLRAAHSALTSSTQESTSEEVASPLRGMEQALSVAERFIETKDRVVRLQGLIQQVDAASTQARRDFKAYGDHGAFSLAGQLVPRLLSREKQQNVDRTKSDVQVMAALLQDINKLLSTCFQYVGKMLEASSCSVGDNRADSNAMDLNVFMLDADTKPGLEAVRTAVPLWLRLYHDVAHASGLL